MFKIVEGGIPFLTSVPLCGTSSCSCRFCLRTIICRPIQQLADDYVASCKSFSTSFTVALLGFWPRYDTQIDTARRLAAVLRLKLYLCILIIKDKEMHYFSHLFWYIILRVSNRSTAHHRETQHFIHSNSYFSG
jgi:hypothetical protein